jgi:hypothetical protein
MLQGFVRKWVNRSPSRKQIPSLWNTNPVKAKHSSDSTSHPPAIERKSNDALFCPANEHSPAPGYNIKANSDTLDPLIKGLTIDPLSTIPHSCTQSCKLLPNLKQSSRPIYEREYKEIPWFQLILVGHTKLLKRSQIRIISWGEGFPVIAKHFSFISSCDWYQSLQSNAWFRVLDLGWRDICLFSNLVLQNFWFWASLRDLYLRFHWREGSLFLPSFQKQSIWLIT